ncbi:hypothetical protein BCV72DRAFT_210761 [Rhizopus microsporus var. microsporus]|uniref:Oxidoreductase-like domain-containing protein n=1 Tax=Rhizopus microsporus var. microsporus TaxID=86635 RepID=A0A1X0QY70_RHIZD|nr:hypothetical protein BCV72DRAFT_210761 [Rhizopus microsporus var. microsporus]
MSIRFIRSIHYKRIPNYRGYWDRILEQPSSNRPRTPIPIPIEIIEEPPMPSRPKQFVYLKGVPLEVPERPEQPTNCCMSGCAHW